MAVNQAVVFVTHLSYLVFSQMSSSVVLDFKQHNYPTAGSQGKEPAKRRRDETGSRNEVQEKIVKLNHENVLKLLRILEDSNKYILCYVFSKKRY